MQFPETVVQIPFVWLPQVTECSRTPGHKENARDPEYQKEPRRTILFHPKQIQTKKEYP